MESDPDIRLRIRDLSLVFLRYTRTDTSHDHLLFYNWPHGSSAGAWLQPIILAIYSHCYTFRLEFYTELFVFSRSDRQWHFHTRRPRSFPNQFYSFVCSSYCSSDAPGAQRQLPDTEKT